MVLNFDSYRPRYQRAASIRRKKAGKTTTGRVLNRHLATVHFSTDASHRVFTGEVNQRPTRPKFNW